MLTPPLPLQPGQFCAFMRPTSSAAGAINPPSANGAAAASLTQMVIQQFSSGVFANPGWSALVENFKLELPLGAKILFCLPVIGNLTSECIFTVPNASVGYSGNQIAITQFGFAGQTFEYANPANNGQVTIFNPQPTAFPTWDPNFQIGIQCFQTNGSSGSDTMIAVDMAIAVYYVMEDGGPGVLTNLPTLTLVTSGPATPDNCLYDDRQKRKLGSIQIDWSLFPVLGDAAALGDCNDFSYPEFTYSKAAAAALGAAWQYSGYQICEIDLATAFGGVGLDEVRSVMVQNRAAWGFLDDGTELLGVSDYGGFSAGVPLVGPSFLTALTTQQTVNLTPTFAEESATYLAQSQCFPFFAIGNALKVRFLNLVFNWSDNATPPGPLPLGKLQCVFANFDMSPYNDGGQVL